MYCCRLSFHLVSLFPLPQEFSSGVRQVPVILHVWVFLSVDHCLFRLQHWGWSADKKLYDRVMAAVKYQRKKEILEKKENTGNKEFGPSWFVSQEHYNYSVIVQVNNIPVPETGWFASKFGKWDFLVHCKRACEISLVIKPRYIISFGNSDQWHIACSPGVALLSNNSIKR